MQAYHLALQPAAVSPSVRNLDVVSDSGRRSMHGKSTFAGDTSPRMPETC